MAMFIHFESNRFKIPRQTRFADLTKKIAEKFKLQQLSDYCICYLDAEKDEISVVDEEDFQVSLRNEGPLEYWVRAENKESVKEKVLSRNITKEDVLALIQQVERNFPAKECDALMDKLNRQIVPCVNCADVQKGVFVGSGCSQCNQQGERRLDERWIFLLNLTESRVRKVLFSGFNSSDDNSLDQSSMQK